jgi:hypothetical protein
VAAVRDLPIDVYSPLSHKRPLDPTEPASTVANWVPVDQRRRLDAYRVLAAYMRNVARWFDRDDPEDPQAWEKRREYGDPAALVRRVRAAVLGDGFQFVVDGADVEPPLVPELPDEPADPGPIVEGEVTALDRRIFELAHARWEQEATRIVDDWEASLTELPALQERQDWFAEWADLEQFAAKAIEAEGDTVGLGDGVYAIIPKTSKGRPELATYDPGFYFPVLDDGLVEQFPRKVHVAWEFEVTHLDGRVEKFVRRLTWEIVPIGVAFAAALDPGSVEDLADAFADAIEADTQTTVAADGTLVRWYPWQDQSAEGAEPSPDTCLFSDGTWSLDDIRGTYADLTEKGAVWALTEDGRPARNIDMRIDFIPVVHLSNTPDTREHFGESLLLNIAQVLDDISAGDTDLQGASALAALPIVGLFGAKKDEAGRIASGQVWSVADSAGSMDVLDLAQAIPELRNLQADLRELASVNSSVPGEVLGRSNAGGAAGEGSSDQLSGISRLLRQGTFKQLIEEMRLTSRDPKYRLLAKMVQRVAQAMGVLPPGPNPTVRLAFGSYLPADLGQVVTTVTDLLTAHAISRRTAVGMLIDAGMEIDDITDELSRIDAEDTAAAVQVADATGSETAAAKRLGVDLEDLPTPAAPVGPPTITLPGAGGGGTG